MRVYSVTNCCSVKNISILNLPQGDSFRYKLREMVNTNTATLEALYQNAISLTGKPHTDGS